MKKALTLAVLLAVAMSAQASWIATSGTTALVDGRIEVQVIPMGPRTSPLGTSLDTYQVNLRALDPADVVSAVEVTFRPTPGEENCGLYQIGYFFPVPAPGFQLNSPDMLVAKGLNDPLSDTHFLLNELCDPLLEEPNDPNTGDWSAGNAVASEDNDRSYGVNTFGEHEGLGTYLSVTAFITAHAIRQNLPFAHIALPAGCTAEFSGQVSNATGDFFSFVDPAIPIPIPEPTTMGLLAFGGLGLLARKRRR